MNNKKRESSFEKETWSIGSKNLNLYINYNKNVFNGLIAKKL